MKMKIEELHKKTTLALQQLEQDSRAELFALRFQSTTGTLENPRMIKNLKKQIAQILTILSIRSKSGDYISYSSKKSEKQKNFKKQLVKMEENIKAINKKRQEKLDQIESQKNTTPDVNVDSDGNLDLNLDNLDLSAALKENDDDQEVKVLDSHKINKTEPVSKATTKEKQNNSKETK